MKRYPAFEPPEYVAWQRDDAVVRQFRETLRRDRARAKIIARLSREQMLDMYRGLVRNRLSDIALKRMVRQGIISKAWLGTGEEAATIGPVHALRRGPGGDVVAPMIRNAGACHEMGMPVADIFRAYMGTGDGPSRGRDGHYGSFAVGVLPPISHLGDVVPVVTGIAMAFQRGSGAGARLRADGQRGRGKANGGLAVKPQAAGVTSTRREPPTLAPSLPAGQQAGVCPAAPLPRRPAAPLRIALTWIGDGTTKAGVTHEGLNLAAVQRVPAIFIIQNNQVALGTRLDQHHLAAGNGNFADWPRAYGMWGGVFDGNNVLDAYAMTALAVERCRRGEGPALLVAETFRMGGHATHDEAEARRTFASELFSEWGRRDPIALYEEYLVEEGVSRDTLASIEAEVEAEIDRAQEDALASRRDRMPEPESAGVGVYAGNSRASGRDNA